MFPAASHDTTPRGRGSSCWKDYQTTPPKTNDTTMMISAITALASDLETGIPRAHGALPPTVITTLSSAVSAVPYPSSPSVALNRLAVTIQRVAQHLG